MFLFLALLLLQIPATTAESVVGDWDLTFSTPQGSTTATVTFKLEGEKITTSIQSPFGLVQLMGSEMPEGDVKMTGTLDVQGLIVDLALNAKLGAGMLQGAVTLGALGDFAFTGKRAEKKTLEPTTEPPADVSGKWTVALSVPGIGEFPGTVTLTQQADTLTGTATSQFGDVPATGTVAGNRLQVEYTVNSPQGSYLIVMTGELGATGLTGTATVGPISGAMWTGVRAQ
jgi:hypothetical protein